MGSEIPMQLQKRVCVWERDRERERVWCVWESVYMNVCIHLQGKDKEMYVWNKMPLSNVSPSKRPTLEKYFLAFVK